MAPRKLLAFAAAASLVLAACGDDDDDDDSAATTAAEATGTTAATEETTEATEDTDDTTATTEATDDTSETTAAEGGGEAFAVDVENCDDPDAASAPIEGAVKIGTSIPLSGGPAVLFAPFGAGMQAYVDLYNQENGGINGAPIELVVKDDQYLADLTKTNVDELVFDEGVHLLSGIIGSPNNAAVQADLNAQCIPQLWAATGAPNWGDVENNPWTSGLLVPYPIESNVWLEYAATQFPDGGTAALYYVNNEFGQAYAEAFKEQAGDYGFEIVAEETIAADDSGAPTGPVTNIVSADPDIVLAVPLGAQCIAFMTELGNQKAANPNFDGLVYQTATCANPIFFGPPGPAADGVFTSSNIRDVNNPDNASDPAVAEYLAAFAASGSDANPGGIAVAGWLAAELTVHALEQAAESGTLSRESIINAVRNIDHAPALLREGLAFQMSPEDGYIAEGTQIQQWSAADARFVDIGDVIDLEGSLGIFGG
jgi:branched-chain amino acid transport system substrate-binding protein